MSSEITDSTMTSTLNSLEPSLEEEANGLSAPKRKQDGGQPSAEAPPQDNGQAAALKPNAQDQVLGSDLEHVASYINFDKYLTKNSANYYYSQKNKTIRNKLEKVKVSQSGSTASIDAIDNSTHGKVSILLERKMSSEYKGPRRLKKDGSQIKPVTKRHSSIVSANTSVESGLSTLSAPVKRTISFSNVHIREHERIAGDNPCVTSGVPLSIGWGSVQHPPIDLDRYEKSKGPSRDKIEMMVPAAIRKEMLRDEFGVSIKELNAAIKDVNITKRNRRSTVAGEHMEGWGEGIESAKRKFGRFLKKTTKEQEQQKLWEQAQKAVVKK